MFPVVSLHPWRASKIDKPTRCGCCMNVFALLMSFAVLWCCLSKFTWPCRDTVFEGQLCWFETLQYLPICFARGRHGKHPADSTGLISKIITWKRTMYQTSNFKFTFPSAHDMPWLVCLTVAMPWQATLRKKQSDEALYRLCVTKLIVEQLPPPNEVLNMTMAAMDLSSRSKFWYIVRCNRHELLWQEYGSMVQNWSVENEQMRLDDGIIGMCMWNWKDWYWQIHVWSQWWKGQLSNCICKRHTSHKLSKTLQIHCKYGMLLACLPYTLPSFGTFFRVFISSTSTSRTAQSPAQMLQALQQRAWEAKNAAEQEEARAFEAWWAATREAKKCGNLAARQT